jgi:hypothetical protein
MAAAGTGWKLGEVNRKRPHERVDGGATTAAIGEVCRWNKESLHKRFSHPRIELPDAEKCAATKNKGVRSFETTAVAPCASGCINAEQRPVKLVDATLGRSDLDACSAQTNRDYE